MHDLSKIFLKCGLQRLYKKITTSFKLSETNILLIMASIVGVIAGFVSILFRASLEFAHHFFFDTVYSYLKDISIYTLPLIPLAGALFLLPFIFFFKDSGGYGMPKFLVNIHLRGGLLQTKNIFIKFVTSIITIATGGSAGVEGPIAQIGGTIGSMTARFFLFGAKRVKVLIACGAAAGIAAQFNAPLAGVLFAQEIIMLGLFQLEIFGAIVIASGIATAMSRAYYSAEPVFGNLNYTIFSSSEIILYCMLGVLSGFGAVIFIRVFYKIGNKFQKLPINIYLKPLVGALTVGLLGLLHIGTLSDGYEHIVMALNNSLEIKILFLLIVLKIIATSITLGSGGVGGVFAPSLFIGAMIGGFFGNTMSYFFPDINASSYALVGMGAFLAAAIHAPLTSIFLLFELTNDYHVIVPVMFSAIIGTMISRKFCTHSIDTYGLAQQGIILEGGNEQNILNNLKVKNIIKTQYEQLTEDTTLSVLLDKITHSRFQYFPIVNSNKKLVGIVSFQLIREFLMESEIADFVVMEDIMVTNILTIKENYNLAQALEVFGIKDIDMLPVTANDDDKKLVGVIFRGDVISYYNSALLTQNFSNIK